MIKTIITKNRTYDNLEDITKEHDEQVNNFTKTCRGYRLEHHPSVNEQGYVTLVTIINH